MKDNILSIVTTRAKASTKALFAVVMSLGGLLQIPAVEDFTHKLFQHHPHVISIIATLGGIYVLMHNPQVQSALGIELPDDAKITGATATVTIEQEPKA